ncbi:hypothetical protein LCGC14_2373450 [marine sediment metagenome]|uniref:Uncharacterized protein n=1 Tax=marine sediment metagenome TaxID=412755 RepID=A0A0F9C324_9ZZZZ
MSRKNPISVTPGPQPKTEQVVSYYEYVAAYFFRRFGVRPSRTTLWHYLTRGYPVQRGGPYVTMPTFTNYRYFQFTTKEAMARFVKLVRKLERAA